MTTIYLVNKKQVEREAAYEAALKLVDRLERPRSGRGEPLNLHLYNVNSELLWTLDQVVRAILDNELMEEKEVRLAA